MKFLRKVMGEHASLRTKFIFFLGLFLISIMFFGAFVLALKQGNIIRSLVTEKGQSISDLLAKTVAEPLLENDVLKLNNTAIAVLDDKEVLYVFFVDKKNRIANSFSDAFNIPSEDYKEWGIEAQDKSRTLNNLLSHDNAVNINSPVLHQDEVLGKVYLGLSAIHLKKIINISLVLLLSSSILITILMSLIIYAMFNQLVFKPLNNIVHGSQKISSGELNTSITLENKDELGIVARTMNQMNNNLRSIVISIKDLFSELEILGKKAEEKSADIGKNVHDQFSLIESMVATIEHNTATLREVSSQSDELKSSSEETSASILELASSSGEIANNMGTLAEEIDNSTSSLQQISSAINDLVEAVTDVSKIVEDTSASAEEIKSSIRDIALLSENSRKLITEIKQQTEETGLTSINKTIDGMKRIKESVEITGEIISILEEKSKEIDKILQVIDDVADRTTLLSFNATILAAQAGRHGKAFAVVGGEIKNLASDTSSSTKEISGIIDMIRKEIKTAVKSMGEGITMVADGFERAEETGRIFHEITAGTQNSARFSDEILTATQEQANGIIMVVNAVQNIDKQMEHLSRVVKEQKEGIDKILVSFERMRDIAHNVKRSTDEQQSASSQISVSAENVSNLAAAIAIALNVISGKSTAILQTIERIKQNAQDNVEATSETSQTINTLLNMASKLKESIDRFEI